MISKITICLDLLDIINLIKKYLFKKFKLTFTWPYDLHPRSNHGHHFKSPSKPNNSLKHFFIQSIFFDIIPISITHASSCIRICFFRGYYKSSRGTHLISRAECLSFEWIFTQSGKCFELTADLLETYLFVEYNVPELLVAKAVWLL